MKGRLHLNKIIAFTRRVKIKHLTVPVMSLLVGFSGLTTAIKNVTEARAQEIDEAGLQSYGFTLASYQK